MKVPIGIQKAAIRRLVQFRGQVNADPLVIGGATYEPGSVVYVGFAGAHVGDGIYEGHYVFRDSQPRDIDADRFVKTDLWQGAPVVPVETDEQGGSGAASDMEIGHGIH